MSEADPLTAAMRDKIARIVDPFAFDDSKWEGKGAGIRAALKAAAYAKADQIMELDFGFDDLPAELQQLVAELEPDLTGADLLRHAAAASFPALEGTDGRPAYTAIVKPTAGGALSVAVLVDEDLAPGDDRPAWVCGTLAGADAQHMAAELEVAAAGGGHA